MYSYADMHCDTLLRCIRKGEDSLFANEGMQSLQQMKEANQMSQFFAIFFPPKGRLQSDQSPAFPPDETMFEQLRDILYRQVEKHSDIVAMAHNYEEIKANWKEKKSSAILTIEDGRMVQGEMDTLHYLHKKGVRAIALTWNFANCFGYPNSKDPEIMKKGLTDFGKEAIPEMNDLGILVDVSHLSDGGFYDVASLSKKPFIASHSNCRAVTNHTRNLTDDMIKVLAQKGGVSGINFGPNFTNPDPTADVMKIEYLVNHILHFIKVGGEDCVGIGTDFDGVGGELEISHPTQVQLLFAALEKKGVTPRQLDKLANENVLRVIRDSMQ